MGFSSSYRRDTKKESSEKHNSTILPFWGFTYKKDSRYTHGTVHTTDSYGRPKEIHGLDAHYYEEFVRTKASPSKELENKFTELLFKEYKDVWSTPYIHPSIDSYYKSTLGSKVANFFLICAVVSIIPGLYFLFKTMVGPFWITLLIFLVSISLFGLLDDHAKNKQYDEKPFYTLPKEQQEKLWEAYLNTMTTSYGTEMGKILQEAAKKHKY